MSKTDMKFKMLKIYQNLFQNNFERVGVTEKTRLVNCRRWAKSSKGFTFLFLHWKLSIIKSFLKLENIKTQK